MSEPYDLPGVDHAPSPATGPSPVGADTGMDSGADTDVDTDAGAGAGAPQDVPPAGQPPEPLGIALPATGNAEVDMAVERLRDADRLPVHAHIEVYEDVHGGLRDALTALDEDRG